MTAEKGNGVRYLTPAAAAKKTGIPRSIIERALNDHALTYLQPNGERGWRLIHPDDLDEWVGSITVKAKDRSVDRPDPASEENQG